MNGLTTVSLTFPIRVWETLMTRSRQLYNEFSSIGYCLKISILVDPKPQINGPTAHLAVLDIASITF